MCPEHWRRSHKILKLVTSCWYTLLFLNLFALRFNSFSLKTAVDSPPPQSVRWNDMIRFKGIVPKHSICCWMAIVDELKTKCLLSARNILTDTCILCNHGPETISHLFIDCNYSCQDWDSVSSKFRITRQRSNFIVEQISFFLNSCNQSRQARQGKATSLLSSFASLHLFRQFGRKETTESLEASKSLGKAPLTVQSTRFILEHLTWT